MNAPDRCSGIGRRGEQLSFLEQPPFSPEFPKPATLADRLLHRLLAGECLNHQAFENGTNSWRLAAYVHDLRGLGWPVKSTEIPASSSTCPSRTIALYYLPDWVRSVVGEVA